MDFLVPFPLESRIVQFACAHTTHPTKPFSFLDSAPTPKTQRRNESLSFFRQIETRETMLKEAQMPLLLFYKKEVTKDFEILLTQFTFGFSKYTLK